MHVVVVFALLAFVVADDKYTTKYDNVDLDAVLKSERLLNNYFKCIMDQGPCTPDGTELKKNMPDSIETDCSKCSDKQKEMTSKIIKFLFENKKDMYDQLEAKFDPEKKYRKKNGNP